MRKLKAADLFCGAGGTTTGAEASGCVDVVLAVNHWHTAIQTHRENHPGTRHICARIDDIDPRHDATIPDLDLILASPECTYHSIARGGRPIDDQKRATPWHVCVWAEAKRPKWLVIENVREFRDWGPLLKNGRPDPKRKGETYRAWVQAIESLGYQVDCQILNAADFGAATKRSRLFVVARRGNSRRDIPWPEATHAGRWRPAYEVIDWSRPCPSIFGRNRPLAEKTLRRIEIGLRKFCGEAFVAQFRRNMAASSMGDPLSTITAAGTHHGLVVPFQFKALGRCPGLTKAISEPLPTIVAARANHAVVMPYLLQTSHTGTTGRASYVRSAEESLPTITGSGEHAVVAPFLVNYHGGTDPQRDGTERSAPTDEPLPVVSTENRYGLVSPYLLAINHGGDDDRSHSTGEPISTLTTKTGHSIVLPFLTKYNGTGGAQPIDEPVDTIPTKDRFGLAMASLLQTMRELQVIDIGFRMLEPDELAAAQGFPSDYQIFGSKADQVRQIGNAVCPPVAEAICRTIGNAA